MKDLDWGKLTPRDIELIKLIGARALKLNLNEDDIEVMMDIAAVHIMNKKLDLQRLLDATDFNFAHDINGIRGNIDVTTGKLRNSFLPRYLKFEDEI